jgi:hypothetical protein
MGTGCFLAKALWIFWQRFVMFYSQTMDIVDMAIHSVVCQKSYFHRSSDFKNSQKLDSLQILAEKLSGQNLLALQK